MLISEEDFESFLWDALPLMREHNDEVDRLADGGFNPDYEWYFDSNMKVVTVRDDNKLVGYIAMHLHHDPHHKLLVRAYIMGIFLLPVYRVGMTAIKLFKKAEAVAKASGAHRLYCGSRPRYPIASLLEFAGMEVTEVVYVKDL